MRTRAAPPRRAPTLDAAARNPDGTYNGFRALAWMDESLHPGKGKSVEEIGRLWQELVSKGKSVRTNPPKTNQVVSGIGSDSTAPNAKCSS
jgi:hypothetical protein